MNLVVGLLSLRGSYPVPEATAWTLLDIALFAVSAWGLWRCARWAAITAVTLQSFSLTVLAAVSTSAMQILPLVASGLSTLVFIGAVRGSVAYHRHALTSGDEHEHVLDGLVSPSRSNAAQSPDMWAPGWQPIDTLYVALLYAGFVSGAAAGAPVVFLCGIVSAVLVKWLSSRKVRREGAPSRPGRRARASASVRRPSAGGVRSKST